MAHCSTELSVFAGERVRKHTLNAFFLNGPISFLANPSPRFF